MNAVNAIALSALISLTGWLKDGLTAYDAKQYDKAVAELSKVCDSKLPIAANFKDIALFCRAKSYIALKRKKEALADLANIATKHANSPFADSARKLYLESGGDPKGLLPPQSPKAVWLAFMAAARKGDADAALKLSTGQWKELLLKELRRKQDRRRWCAEFARSNFAVGEETIGEGGNAGTATLELTPMGMDRPLELHFVLDNKHFKWLIQRFGNMSGMKSRDGIEIDNINKLKQIGLGCRIYSNAHGENFPPNLKILKKEGYLENEDIYLWTNPGSGKKFPFIYCPGLTEASSVNFIVAAAPMPYNGTRPALYLDGHVKSIPEKEFIRQAALQKWKIKRLIRKKDMPKNKVALIEKLIKQLGSDKFTVRRDAKKQLVSMGVDAFPILEEHLNDKDPEIKMSVKEIINQR